MTKAKLREVLPGRTGLASRGFESGGYARSEQIDGLRSLNGATSGIVNSMLDEATGGVVPRSYATNLRKGSIENPGYEKVRAIAKAMGFPPEAWFEDAPEGGAPAEGRDLAARVEDLAMPTKAPHRATKGGYACRCAHWQHAQRFCGQGCRWTGEESGQTREFQNTRSLGLRFRAC